MTIKEQNADREEVWKQMAEKHPEFPRAFDIANNHHAVREIVLGGSVTWAGVHARFEPAPGMRVMDIGANAGIFSAYCAAKGADVTAYEAHPVVFQFLERLAAEPSFEGRLKPIHAAVWTSAGTLPFLGHTSPTEWCNRHNGSLQTEGINWTPDDKKRAEMVRCISLEDALGHLDWDCVKIDIEGAEADILLAAPRAALERIRFCFLELHPWVSQETYEKTIAWLQDVFMFEGAWKSEDGRWEAVYLRRKY